MRATHLSAIACLAALALAGCGRRGPLELPPGAPPQPAAVSDAQANRVLGNQDNPGLIQSPNVKTVRTPAQKEQDIFSEGQVARPINAPPQPKTGFVLDPLL